MSIPGRPVPGSYPQSSSFGAKTPVTLEELESSLKRTNIVGSFKGTPPQNTPVASGLSETPKQKDLQKLPDSFFLPMQENETFQALTKKSSDPYSGLMTKEDKEYIARIHLYHLSSMDSRIEDYYYRLFSTKKENVSQKTLYLPFPEAVAKRKPKVTDLSLKGALGKIPLHSVRNPRQVLQVEETKENKEVKPTTNSSEKMNVLQVIEKLYDTLNKIEDLNDEIDETTRVDEKEDLDVKKADLFNNCYKELLLDQKSNNPDPEFIFKFLQFRKGKRIFKRLLPLMSAIQKQQFFDAVLSSLENLDVVNPLVSADQVNR
jgi:hypothetical protein